MSKVKNKKLPSYEEVKGEFLPLLGYSDYLVHPDLGKVYRVSTGKWLLSNNPKGCGDRGYLQTSLKNDLGETVQVYEHECVVAAVYGIPVKSWLNEGLFGHKMQIDHIDRNVKNNTQSNLRLVTKREQYSPDVLADMRKVGNRLTGEDAKVIRAAFSNWSEGKIAFYEAMSEKYSVCKRTIQNIILNISFKSAL